MANPSLARATFNRVELIYHAAVNPVLRRGLDMQRLSKPWTPEEDDRNPFVCCQRRQRTESFRGGGGTCVPSFALAFFTFGLFFSGLGGVFKPPLSAASKRACASFSL